MFYSFLIDLSHLHFLKAKEDKWQKVVSLLMLMRFGEHLSYSGENKHSSGWGEVMRGIKYPLKLILLAFTLVYLLLDLSGILLHRCCRSCCSIRKRRITWKREREDAKGHLFSWQIYIFHSCNSAECNHTSLTWYSSLFPVSFSLISYLTRVHAHCTARCEREFDVKLAAGDL